ncbi:DUF4931 domain-containing protein [Candidatus Woesearchaeota archaeon]|nr:DUF4931 domain-containing protein [Candidatus Woesearchaeota archaeon]
MGELRKDYILDKYVIIATERGARPDQFKKEEKTPTVKTDFFAPGNEAMTPNEIERFPPGAKDWQIRVFPNKFAAVKPEGNPALRTANTFFTYSDAFGYHEVIVETPNIDETLADLSEERISNVLKMFKKRIEVNMSSEGVKYVSVFKNHGERAGTSVQHSHCQLIAYNLVPEIILRKENAVKRYLQCPYCAILNIEKNSHRRCFENNSFVAFTPYASRFPFEIWVFPKRHILNITEFTEDDFVFLAEILKKILLKLKSLNADYNLFLQYGIENMHFHIEITPRLSKWAGFELDTETIINIVTPENAAEFYRS